MLEKYCDILVIGTEIPGLVTAAFLAKRGLSVQIVDSDFYSDHEKLPDPYPLTNIHSKLLRSILGRLNVPEVKIQDFLNTESTLQYIFPKQRIDVIENPLLYFEEIDREFPDLAQEIKSFYEKQARIRHKFDVNELYKQLIPSTWREKHNFKKFVAEQNLNQQQEIYERLIKKKPEIKTFFESQMLLCYHMECLNPFSYQVAELFNPGDGEAFSICHGQKVLKDILIDRIIHHDGHIRHKTSPEKMLFRNGAFEGIETRESKETVLAKYVIWNTSLVRLQDILPDKWKFKKLRSQCDLFAPKYHWFTTRFEIDKNYIPDPLKHNAVLVQNPKKELLGANFLYLQTYDNPQSDICELSANFLLGPEALAEKNEYFTPVFEEIEAILTKLLPFSNGKLKRVFPIDPESLSNNDTLFPIHENDFDIFKHTARVHGIIEQRDKNFLELFHIHYKTPAPNLFLSHPHIFYAFGLESKLTLGLKITDLIWQETEKTKKRAMKTERRIA